MAALPNRTQRFAQRVVSSPEVVLGYLPFVASAAIRFGA